MGWLAAGVCRFFFFFQAEDGIRDDLVTGVQTCALPISSGSVPVGGQLRLSTAGTEPEGRYGLPPRWLGLQRHLGVPVRSALGALYVADNRLLRRLLTIRH